MEIEAIDDRPSNPQGASRENGEALSAAIPATTERLAPIEVSTLTERIESLERQHSQLRRGPDCHSTPFACWLSQSRPGI